MRNTVEILILLEGVIYIQFLIILAIVACFNGLKISTAVIALIIHVLVNIICKALMD